MCLHSLIQALRVSCSHDCQTGNGIEGHGNGGWTFWRLVEKQTVFVDGVVPFAHIGWLLVVLVWL